MTTEFVASTIDHALKMLEEGTPQHKILSYLASAAEAVAEDGDAVASILVLDKEGLLRNGASPQLPYDYLTAIDGLKPNANLGTCAAVAATGEMMLTPDFQADDKWAELRHLPMALGFYSAWSMPIKNESGKVLGTFGTYFRVKREPTADEISAVRSFSEIAAIVLN